MAPAEQSALAESSTWKPPKLAGPNRHVLRCWVALPLLTRASHGCMQDWSLSLAGSTRSVLATTSIGRYSYRAVFCSFTIKTRRSSRVFRAQWTAAKQIVLNTLDQWHREQPNQRGFAANQLTPKLPQGYTFKELLVEMITAKLIRGRRYDQPRGTHCGAVEKARA